MSDPAVTEISGYRFTPDHLNIAGRKPGISAFMRIKNGAEFLEPTIRSHIDHFDEVVAMFNGCTDKTEEILLRMRQEYGPKIRLFHYTHRVFPPGSEGHKAAAPDAPDSLVNYYNCALAQTQYQIVTKLDDDHLGIEDELAKLVQRVRSGEFSVRTVSAFSGLILSPYMDRPGLTVVLLDAPISGKGDIGFFRVHPDTYFLFDKRFERFNKKHMSRKFSGYVYWHLKFL